MLEVTEIKYIDNYTLWLSLNDGTVGTVDLESSIWGPAFEPLHDVNLFKKAFISSISHTVTWPNEVDFAPEYLKDKLLEHSRMMQASEDVVNYKNGCR